MCVGMKADAESSGAEQTEQDPCFANELGHLLAKPTWYQPCIEPMFHLIDSHPSEIAWTAAVTAMTGVLNKKVDPGDADISGDEANGVIDPLPQHES